MPFEVVIFGIPDVSVFFVVSLDIGKRIESPLGLDYLQKVPFVASNPILTHYQLQKIEVR
jgi:hypothetical protein